MNYYRNVFLATSDCRDRKKRDLDAATKEFEVLNMKSVVETLAARGFNPTDKLVDVLPELELPLQARVLQALAEMGQRELVAEKKEVKHEGTLTLLDVLEAASSNDKNENVRNDNDDEVKE